MAQENLVLDSTIREFLDELAANEGPLVYQLTPDEARSTLVRAQSGTVRKPDAQIKDWNVDSAVGALRLFPRPLILSRSSVVDFRTRECSNVNSVAT